MSFFNLVVAVCFTVWVGYVAISSSAATAMKVCQLSHSHDVCFQALNR